MSDVLSADRRRDLAIAVFDHVLSVVLPVGAGARHVLVVTDSSEIEDRVRRRAGTEFQRTVTVLRETAARGETAAVEDAARWSIEMGFDRQIVIPADLPCVRPEDIEKLMDEPLTPPAALLCPATGDDGTNAILTTPPDALKFRFGKRSFPDYLNQARARGVTCRVIRLPRMALDLDTPEDLLTFIEEPKEGEPYRLVTGWNLQLT
ncbi:MAG: 2-phospho-L-lactate guanylyltransferase [Candidatus Lindowbacteria bacterium RIFCSPLOWO2_12_FULL_62_27]|nr:MAG: 2-phospho-L-lactate guanylyltransferase [Candidatus Lindowbacteria bacterium RIFCSPLOWO2_02_FULL_62_12]OGH62563.1 MAG: 2-phospho-L-lactate guanylyltransferase [Candidatus Lindowbacteria bacterium RIFCSPLOWO2_12_FULL_62_27]